MFKYLRRQSINMDSLGANTRSRYEAARKNRLTGCLYQAFTRDNPKALDCWLMTHTQESRREAHERIKPKKGSVCFEIINMLATVGPCTSDWIYNCLGKGVDSKTDSVNSIRARLSELRDMGRIQSVGRKKNIFGRKVTVWAINHSMTPPPKKTTWKDRALVAESALSLVRLELKAAELRIRGLLRQ